MSTTSEFCQLGMLNGLGQSNFDGDDSTPKDRPGRFAYVVDAFGTRIFQYGRNCKGSAITMGECLIRLADIAVSNITSGTTLSAVKASAWTADKSVGELLYVEDNDDSAGAAPEGEVGVIGSNSSGVANLDPQYPLTVALAANDDLDTISPGWHFDTSGAAAKAQECRGIACGKDGITSLNYGWTQVYGIVPVAQLKASTGFTDRAAIITGVSKIDVDANGGWELVIGHSLGTVTSDIVSDKAMCFINVYSPTLNAGTP